MRQEALTAACGEEDRRTGCGRGGGKIVQSWRTGRRAVGCRPRCGMPFSGHDTAAVLMSSQRLWLLVQESSSSQNSSKDGGGAVPAPPLTEELLPAVTYWGESLGDVVTRRFPVLQGRLCSHTRMSSTEWT